MSTWKAQKIKGFPYGDFSSSANKDIIIALPRDREGWVEIENAKTSTTHAPLYWTNLDGSSWRTEENRPYNVEL